MFTKGGQQQSQGPSPAQQVADQYGGSPLVSGLPPIPRKASPAQMLVTGAQAAAPPPSAANDDDATWNAQMQATLNRNQKWAKPGDYTTKLSADDESKFQAWVKDNKVPFNPRDKISDYDMRGFWQAAQRKDPAAETGVDPNDGKLHFTDRWKTPFHQTFSNQSMYAKPNAPHWEGDKLVDENGKLLFDDAAGAKKR